MSFIQPIQNGKSQTKIKKNGKQHLIRGRSIRSQKAYGSVRKNLTLARAEIQNQRAVSNEKGKRMSKADFIFGLHNKQELAQIGGNIEDYQYKTAQLQYDGDQKSVLYPKINYRKAQRIMSSLKSDANLKRQRNKQLYSIKQKNHNTEIYRNFSAIYKEMIEKQIDKNQDELSQFIESIKDYNRFLDKIHPLLSLSFFKMGVVKLLQPKQYLYYQNDPSYSFFIVLWGELKSKQIHTKKKLFIFPGDTLSQQIVIKFQGQRKKSVNEFKLVNRMQPRLQTVKAITHCGVLQLIAEEYEKVKKTFSQNGQKERFYLAQKIISWGLLKKMQLRK